MLNRVPSLPMIHGISFSQPQLSLNNQSPLVRKRASFVSKDSTSTSSSNHGSFLQRTNTSPIRSSGTASFSSSPQLNPTLLAIERARAIVENEEYDESPDFALHTFPNSNSSFSTDSSLTTPSAGNSPTRRYSYRLHDHVLSSLPTDEQLVLMTRSDALKAQGEEKLLASDKPHLRNHIQKKYNI